MNPTRSRSILLLAGAALLVLTCAGGAGAAGGRRAMQPHAITGALIHGGADGADRTLMCPPDENVLGGGYTVSAEPGRHLAATPADVRSSRPTGDATGWTVAVHKATLPNHGAGAPEPSDLTLQIVCTEGQTSPGG